MHSSVSKLSRYLTDSDFRFLVNARRGIYRRMPDEAYLTRYFRAVFGRDPDLQNPKTFSEKLQWLKLNDRRPEYTMMADKYLVRDYIARQLGPEYLIPLLGVWERPEDIDFDALPDRFVLKCNHNSGLGMCICKDKSSADIPAIRSELKKGLAQDYYLTGREWPYKNIPRRIIAEQYMEDSLGSGDLSDYKLHFFSGQCRAILVGQNRFSSRGVDLDFYTPDWEHLSVSRAGGHNADTLCPRPEQLDELLALGKVLARDYPFVRVDFYIINHRPYFGEITFYPASGFTPFRPDEWDTIFGDWVHL